MVGQIWSTGCSLLTSDFRTHHLQCWDMWNTKLLINTEKFLNYIIKLLGKWFGKWRIRTRGTALFEKKISSKSRELIHIPQKNCIMWKVLIKYLLVVVVANWIRFCTLVKCSFSKPQISKTVYISSSGKSYSSFLFVLVLFCVLMGARLLYNVVLVAAMQQVNEL